MKLGELFESGICSRQECRVVYFVEKRLDIVEVKILTPYFLDMFVRKIYLCGSDLTIMIDTEGR